MDWRRPLRYSRYRGRLTAPGATAGKRGGARTRNAAPKAPSACRRPPEWPGRAPAPGDRLTTANCCAPGRHSMQRRLQAQRAASGAESPHVVGYRREHRPTDLAASLLPGIPSFDQPAFRCADATPHGEAGVRLAGPAPAEATPHAVYG